MLTFEIYFDDLCKEKQQELLDALGDNGNYDVFPLAVLEFEENNNENNEKEENK